MKLDWRHQGFNSLRGIIYIGQKFSISTLHNKEYAYNSGHLQLDMNSRECIDVSWWINCENSLPKLGYKTCCKSLGFSLQPAVWKVSVSKCLASNIKPPLLEYTTSRTIVYVGLYFEEWAACRAAFPKRRELPFLVLPCMKWLRINSRFARLTLPISTSAETKTSHPGRCTVIFDYSHSTTIVRIAFIGMIFMLCYVGFCTHTCVVCWCSHFIVLAQSNPNLDDLDVSPRTCTGFVYARAPT